MFKGSYHIPLTAGQHLKLVGLGDVHFDTPECDRPRLRRFIGWVQAQQKMGNQVRLAGTGDYLDFGSPSERSALPALHETTAHSLDAMHMGNLTLLWSWLKPIKSCFLGLLTGHHEYFFAAKRVALEWKGKSSDAWLAHRLGCDFWGNGVSLFRLTFPHDLYLDVLAYHGSGGAQTPGGRVQKRIRIAEIVPTAHIVMTGHDNAKLAYPRSGLDYEHGVIKRYVIGTGSFQRAYLEGEDAGYAERRGLVPADLGVTVVDIQIEKRNGRWRVDYHASV